MANLDVPKSPPRTFALGGFHFSVLGPECAEEDFAAITSSEAHLFGVFGSEWPKGMTWEKNVEDLERHAREFDEDSAFAWVIRNSAGDYLGCLYLRPQDTTRASGEVYLWLQASETSPARVSDLTVRVKDWMAGLGYDPERYPVVSPKGQSS